VLTPRKVLHDARWGNEQPVALILHRRTDGRSWRFEADKQSKLELALGAHAKAAVVEYKQSYDDPKWVLLVYDERGLFAALARDALPEFVGKLGDLPELRDALSD
jgi:hypothetical protein